MLHGLSNRVQHQPGEINSRWVHFLPAAFRDVGENSVKSVIIEFQCAQATVEVNKIKSHFFLETIFRYFNA